MRREMTEEILQESTRSGWKLSGRDRERGGLYRGRLLTYKPHRTSRGLAGGMHVNGRSSLAGVSGRRYRGGKLRNGAAGAGNGDRRGRLRRRQAVLLR